MLRTVVQFEQPIPKTGMNTHPKLTICASSHQKQNEKSEDTPVKCLSFVSARVPVSARISAADIPCRSSTVCVSKGFFDWTSGLHRVVDVEKERKTVRFGRTSCRRRTALAIVVVVEDES